MAITAVSLRWKLLGAAAAALLALACGDDDKGGGGTTPTTPTNSPGTTAQLGPNVAGKACTTATECGGAGATCASKQTFGAVSVVLGVAGLGETALDAPGGSCTRTCNTNAECGEGGVCFGALAPLASGECRKTCTSNADCRSPDYECAKQVQAAPRGDAGVAPAVLPSTCQPFFKADKLAPEQTGLTCNAQDMMSTVCGDGFCGGGTCTGICNSDADCSTGGACIPIGYGSTGFCAESCTADTDCNGFAAGGVGCVDSNGRKLCGAKIFPLAPNVVGNACTDAKMCSTGDCATGLGLPQVPAPGGYCSLLGCQADSECGGGACVASAFGSRCYKTCTASTDCRTGYSCANRRSSAMATIKVCAPIPANNDGGVPAGPRDAGSNTPDTGVVSSTPVDAGTDAS